MNQKNLVNSILIFALILSIFSQEVLSVIYFQKLIEIPFVYFIVYTILVGVFSFIWGNISDFFSKKYSLFLSLVFGCIPIYFALNEYTHLALFTSPLLIPAPIARALMASHKFTLWKSKEASTKNLMKVSWLVVFSAWIFYEFIKQNPHYCSYIAWGASIVLTILVPARKIAPIKEEKPRFNLKSFALDFRHFGLGLLAFCLMEFVFFTMWSFSEKTHVVRSFFPFVGACCFAGTLLSFFFDPKELHLRTIRNAYFYIMLACFASLITFYTFNEINAWWAVVSFTATIGGIYLPYVYDQAIAFYDKHEKGRACGIVETISSTSEILASVLIKEVTSPKITSLILFLISVVGYTVHSKQKKLEVSKHEK